MEQLNRLTTTLNVLRQLSQNIISKTLPIMKELENPDNDLVDEFLQENGGFDRPTAAQILQNISLELIADAQTINREIESFSDAVIHGEDGIAEGENDYPFLLEVWYGDMYGETGVKGLQALVSDLREQFSKIDEDTILEIAISRLEAE